MRDSQQGSAPGLPLAAVRMGYHPMTTAIFDGKAFPNSDCFSWRMNGMSLYLLRFKVETCLTKQEDLVVEFGGSHPVFLFSQKTADDKHVIAQVEMEAP